MEYERTKASFYIGYSGKLLAFRNHDLNGFLFPRKVYEILDITGKFSNHTKV